MTVEVKCGDFREILQGIPDGKFDCCIADPPYGETSLVWDRWPSQWPSLIRRVVKPSGSMWVFGSLRMFMKHWSEFSGWRMSHEVVWEKHNGTGLFADRFRRVHELAVHFYPADSRWSDVFKSPQYTNDARARVVRKKGGPAQWIGATKDTVYRSEDGGPRLMRSVQFVRSEHGRAVHPTQKPLGIVEPLLRYACPPAGFVIDPFAGSGTTGIAAARCGMSGLLIELNPEYAKTAQDRLSEVPEAIREGVFG